MSKIMSQGRNALISAYQKGKTLSRHEEKKAGKDHLYIFASKSLESHLKNWEKFAEWAEGQGLKRIGQLKEEHFKRYLLEQTEVGGRKGLGASKKTIESYIGAMNKVMMASGRWELSEKMELGKMKEIKVKELPRNVYKDLTAQEWRERNEKAYALNADTFDTVSAFGLRAKELNELTERSFLMDRDGKMYVQTIGKGGKYRVAEVANKELNERMVNLYGKYAIKVDNPREYGTKEGLERIIRNQDMRLNLKGSNNHKLPKHIFRAEYAQKLLETKLEGSASVPRERVGYSHLKADKEEYDRYEVKIGTYQGSAKEFLEVSRNLGHNRLDVLLKYL